MDAARGGLPDPCGGPQPVKARRAGRPGPKPTRAAREPRSSSPASLRWIRWVAFKGYDDKANAEK